MWKDFEELTQSQMDPRWVRTNRFVALHLQATPTAETDDTAHSPFFFVGRRIHRSTTDNKTNLS